jgi:hypothetical protein
VVALAGGDDERDGGVRRWWNKEVSAELSVVYRNEQGKVVCI